VSPQHLLSLLKAEGGWPLPRKSPIFSLRVPQHVQSKKRNFTLSQSLWPFPEITLLINNKLSLPLPATFISFPRIKKSVQNRFLDSSRRALFAAFFAAFPTVEHFRPFSSHRMISRFLFSLVNPLDVGLVNLSLRGFCSDKMEDLGWKASGVGADQLFVVHNLGLCWICC